MTLLATNHICIASDHAGLLLKTSIITHLQERGARVTDFGTNSSASCDYPTYAQELCAAVLAQQIPGILICGSGIGMSIAANRFSGIRAALCTHEFHALASRQHNNANVLCIGERITAQGLALRMIETFLTTPFEGGRHARRVELLENTLSCKQL